MIQAVIFNLDGVLVTTDACHFEAWKKMAKEHGIPFDQSTYERIRGMSRLDGLDIILRKARRPYSPGEKWALATRKNDLYMECIAQLGTECVLPGAQETVMKLKDIGYKIAVGSSSQNAVFILKQLGIREFFDAVADGNQIERLKPDPEVFLLAAHKLGMAPEQCLVVEDSPDGILAARAGGMMSLGVREAASCPQADFSAASLLEANLPLVLKRMQFEAEKYGVPSKGAPHAPGF